MSVVMLSALILAPVAFIVMSNCWRFTFFAAIVLAILEGAIRKWAFPGVTILVYFLKDFMLLAVYFGYFTRAKRRCLTPAAKSVAAGLMMCCCFAFVQAANPNSPSFLLYLIGLKSYFIYIPIAFIFPALLRNQPAVMKFLRSYIVIAIPIALLGFVQLYAGPTHWISVYASHTADAAHVSRFGDNFGRTSGTFSYVGGFTTYLTFICCLSVAYLAQQNFRLENSRWVIVALTICFGAMFTTGSRGPIVIFSLLVMISTVYGAIRGWLSSAILLRILIGLPLIGYLGLQLSPEAVEGLAQRASTTDNNLFRLIGPFYQPIMVMLEGKVPFLGFGMGSTHNASLVVMGASEHWWLGDVRAESETARIIIEIGIPGFLLYYGFLITSILRSSAPLFKMGRRADKLFALVFTTFLLMMTLSPLVNNPMAGIYFWMSIGLLHSYYYHSMFRFPDRTFRPMIPQLARRRF